MYTNNFNFNLMAEYQIGKELVFNETTNKLDWFLNRAIEAIVDSIPISAIEGTIFIYNTIDYNDENTETKEDLIQPNTVNKLACYINGKWRYSIPKPGMLLYVKQLKNFVILDENNEWNEVFVLNNNNKNLQTNQNITYISTDGVQQIINDLNYIYLNNNTMIDLSEYKSNKLVIVVKQSSEREYSISFNKTVIWSKEFNRLIFNCNSINIIKIMRLPDDVWLGKIEASYIYS